MRPLLALTLAVALGSACGFAAEKEPANPKARAKPAPTLKPADEQAVLKAGK